MLNKIKKQRMGAKQQLIRYSFFSVTSLCFKFQKRGFEMFYAEMGDCVKDQRQTQENMTARLKRFLKSLFICQSIGSLRQS